MLSRSPPNVDSSNRDTAPGAVPLLAQPDFRECMPIWAAARCTSAAAPHVHTFIWQGRMFLDGSFQLGCPAAAALSEAQSLWPNKRRDVLVSLGTGIPASREGHSLHDTVKFGSKEVVVDTSSENMWEIFHSRAEPGVFRLSPVYSDAGFSLADFERVSEIEAQTESWLADHDQQLTVICDHLIASLFYFRQKSFANSILEGDIHCRLPVALDSRQNLVRQMRNEIDRGLFVAELRNGYSQKIIVEDSVDDIHPGNELRIPVTLSDLPVIMDEVKIDIKMRNMGSSSAYRWNHISGSPYIL
jgi:hypothetical protein